MKGKTIGIDLGDKNNWYCVLGKKAEVEDRGKVACELGAMKEFLKKHKGSEVVIEAGTHSGWVSDLCGSLGVNVLVANPREVASIWKSSNKTDERDAEQLARLARADRKLLKPVETRERKHRLDLTLIKSREGLVRARVELVCLLRSLVKNFGYRLKETSTKCFSNQIQLPEELRGHLKGVLESIESLSKRIQEYDVAIQKQEENYPEVKKLQQVPGVGKITSMAYVLLVESPHKFKTSRDAGAYLGLKPKRDQSGKIDKELGISKTGNSMLRRLLVNCSQYILGRFGPDSDLKRFGHKLIQRGGRSAKKKAVIAVARKLAVLLHALWKSDQPYQPLRTQKI